MAEYKDEEKPFEVWTRPLWDWAYDILSNPHLANHFRWDAERHYKFNGEQFERFIDEPWTADAWWEIQVSKKITSFFPPLSIIYHAMLADNSPRRCCSIFCHCICRQKPVVFFWDSQRVSCNCTLCTPSNYNPKW